MKRFCVTFGLLFATGFCFAQENPVHFAYSVKKTGDKNYELHVVATLDEGWHLYSQTQPKEAVAQPTTIKLAANPMIKVVPGKAKEIGKKEVYENKEVGIKQFQYGHTVEFVQGFTLKAAVKTNLSGTVTYQVCTDERCLNVKTISFNVDIE